MSLRFLLAAALALLVAPALAQPGGTLAAVKARGELVCGVSGTLAGFARPDEAGVMRGFDADFCRAVAAAVLGDANRLRYVPIPTPDAGFAALAEQRIDLLARNTTFTYLRQVTHPIAFAGITFFDGQGLLVRRDAGIASFRHLDGRRICVTGIAGSLGREVIEVEAAEIGIAVTVVDAGGNTDLLKALRDGVCDAASTDASQLAVRRVTEMPDPDSYVLLRETLSREPLGLLVRAGDEAWRRIVFWILQAMLEADEYGVTSGNLLSMVQANDPVLRRLIGVEPGLGQELGLDEEWSQRVLAQVGSYAEVFDRNLGEGSRFGLDRGPNDNWRRGGLMFPRPLR